MNSIPKDFSLLKITLASPEQILSWSHGEVIKAETINYRTQRAEVDGLMCEKIFGPTKNFECYCGKYKKIRYKGIICDKCGVEVTNKRVRRERMGHIVLASPVVHVWFSHGIPNKLSLVMDIPQKSLETVIYFARYLVVEVDNDKKKEALKKVEEKLKEDLSKLSEELKSELKELTENFSKEKKELSQKSKKGIKLDMQLESLKIKNKKETAETKEHNVKKEAGLREKYSGLRNLVDKIDVGGVISEEEYHSLLDNDLEFFSLKMGAEAVKTLLEKVDLDTEIKRLTQEKINTRSLLKKRKIVQRLRILYGLKKNNIKPQWLVMDVLPVIPPELRPIIQLPGGRFATSDLNDLYRRVINRNNRLKRLIELGAPEIIVRNEKRMLQEAVDALVDNSHRPGKPILNTRGQPYKSLADMLRGKQGRFRQNLLGKRVDYSGRAVIVAGPDLDIYECGLPTYIALELFKPFVIREIIARGLAPNIKSAKNYLEARSLEVWDILEEVIKGRPVLLNRAPTLHKQGIQAFYPILTEGDAIRIHPMICKGFNADFDGDQMAVHVPITKEAVEEAKEKMMVDSNMLLVANGSPVVNVNKDMAFGCYFLTGMDEVDEKNIKVFESKESALGAQSINRIGLREKIKVLMDENLVETTAGRLIFNEGLPEGYPFVNKQQTQPEIGELVAKCRELFGKKKTAKLLNYLKTVGFKYATKSAFSVGINDFYISDSRNESLKKADRQLDRLSEDYYNGLITQGEKKSLSEEVWMNITEEVSEATWKEYETKGELMNLEISGSYPIKNPVRQISGIRGLILDPMGNIVELPLRSNYKLGLTSLEYFVAARGTRKGLTDVALRTSESGYLTRKLVDVAQDVTTKEEDCGSSKGVVYRKNENRRLSFTKRILGRWTADKVIDSKTGEVVLDKNQEITSDLANKIESLGIEEVSVRSPLTCETIGGVCQKCYGYDLGTSEMVEKGKAVGVMGAQAMGEAATQLTLDTKHLAARVGTDITQGLPRVEELFEVRVPKGQAVICEDDGVVKLLKNEEDEVISVNVVKKEKVIKEYPIEKGVKVLIKKGGKIEKGKGMLERKGRVLKAPNKGKIKVLKDKIVFEAYISDIKEYGVSEDDEVIVNDGQRVNKGDLLTSGSIDPKDIKSLLGLEDAQKYIIDNVQETYGLQGISINDKHVEVIVRKMAYFVKVSEQGDSKYLPGDFASYLEVERENKELRKGNKVPVKYKRQLMGITSASINTDSFLSAASFQEVVRVLSDACLVGKEDKLRGLKENVIIGRPVPLAQHLR